MHKLTATYIGGDGPETPGTPAETQVTYYQTNTRPDGVEYALIEVTHKRDVVQTIGNQVNASNVIHDALYDDPHTINYHETTSINTMQELINKHFPGVNIKDLLNWDYVPILAERAGKVRFYDIIENKTVREEVDPGSGIKRRVIMEHKGDLHPQIIVEDDDGEPIALYPMPAKAHLEVKQGDRVQPGSLLAKAR